MLLVRNQSNRQILEDIQIQTSWPSCVLYKFWEGNCFATLWGESCEDLFSSESILHSIFWGGSCEDISSSESILQSTLPCSIVARRILWRFIFLGEHATLTHAKLELHLHKTGGWRCNHLCTWLLMIKKNPCNFCRRDIIAGSWILVTNTQEFVKSVTLKLVIPFFVCL